MDMRESTLHHMARSLNPQDAPHYWDAFFLTDELYGPYDDWQMYCMGSEL